MTGSQKLSVFLCHSSADKAAIRDLHNRLLKYPWIDPWLDEEKLLPGHDRNGEISKALEKAHVIIIGLSKDSITKEGHAQAEFKYAQKIALEKPEGAIFIIPLNLEDVKGLDTPSKLKNLQSEDFFPNKRRVVAFEKILRSLKARANMLDILYEESPPIVAIPKPSKNKYAKGNEPLEKSVVSTAEFPIHEIPFRKNPNFTGRKDVLDSIQEEFSASQNRVSIHAIRGMGGIGKTQTAVQYSYEFAKEYDLVYWIRSETDASLTADYEALTQTLQLPVKTKAEQLVYINIVNNWLAGTDKKWLLVFDNVESQEKIEKLVPYKGNGHILITSQSPNWKELGEDSQIRPFTNEEAREFFKKRLVGTELEPSDRLNVTLGGLPLALEQACAYMAAHGTPIEIYIRLFEEQQEELWKRETSPKDYRSTVMTTWEMAFKQIQDTHPAAKQLLNLFAFFGPDDIPISVIKTYSDNLPEELRKAIHNPIELEENLSAIHRYSLVQRNGDFISFHRLVQDVIRTQLPKDIAAKWVSIAVQIMKIAFPYDEYDVKSWANCAQLLPHALATANYAEKYNTGLEDGAEIYQKACEYLQQQGEYERAGEAAESAINIWQETSGGRNEKLAISLNYLGVVRHDQAKFAEAYRLYNLALNIFQAEGSLTTRQLAHNLNNFGVYFLDQGEYGAAQRYFEQALVIHRNLLGENNPDTAHSLSSLGALFRKQGELEKAQIHQEQAFVIRRNVLGENHPDTANSLNNLGVTFSDQGEFERAQNYHEQALAICLNVLGANHPKTAKSLSNMGAVLLRQSKYVAARDYLEQGLSILEKVYGPTHHDLINVLSNLAYVMFHLRLFPQAREYASRAAQICEEAKDKYSECDDIKQLQKSIPMIGKNVDKKKKHK